MPTKSYLLLYFLETYKCQRMNHMNLIHKFDDTKEMFHSNVYVIHLEVFFSNCLHYNRNALICMVNIYLYIYIYILHSTGLHDYDEFFGFHPFKLSSLKSCLGLLGSIPIVMTKENAPLHCCPCRNPQICNYVNVEPWSQSSFKWILY
jgi:hypothetical protein